MTSWRGRIDNVRPIVEWLLQGTLVPNRVVCNLAREEFERGEADLPLALCELSRNEPRFEIWWVDKNTFAFKKLMPTLDRFPEAVVISVDDDFYYERRFVEKMYDSFLKYGKVYPITCRHRQLFGLYLACGAASLYQRKMFGDTLSMIDDQILSTNEDDWFYSYALLQNKVLFKPAIGLDSKLFRPFFPTMPSNDRLYSTKKTIGYYESKTKQLTGLSIEEYGKKIKRECYDYSPYDFLCEKIESRRHLALRRIKQLFVDKGPLPTAQNVVK
ncbi:MAG: hypothetical protein SOZ00_03520 [Tidjanibacter sp.]|nr:hypothetical protein [Tidjanibacter sp.]